MNLDLIELFFGKRFSGLIVVVVCLFFGYLYGPPEQFSQFASTVGLIFGAYVAGQSFTDAKEK